MQDKRGLSAIVATLIIILLVLVAVGIVWVVVRNILQEGAEGIELSRLTLDLSIKSAYIDGANVKVLVRRSSGEGDLIGVRFIFFDGTDSTSVDEKIPLIQTQERLFSFDSDDFDGVGDISVFYEVSVAPIYTSSSGTETVGAITDTATISGSAPPGDNGDNGGTGDPGTGYCGDNIIQNPNGDEVDEICDGTELGGEDCISQGFDEGTLACNVDCLSFDVSSCTSEAPGTCNGIWDGDDVDVNDCDGGANCNPDCTCSAGFSGDGVGGCILDSPVDTGIINSVWNNIFFDSNNLPKSNVVTDFIGYYANFSGGSAEIGCFLITFAAYLSDNDISYLRLDDSLGVPNINTGEGYNIWEAENCGY